ncbi:Unsaturated glucuronyl hydrolase [Anatilimnocola aggregata]|uniref:Unsaturated glucuronyl hydrolase n=1 Tax=Anatilimnocola aggregata TaxID=2528021 RepID=A0A517YIA3_9BACT|nr:glycoside hydrolase family 88 protein [Anatilimnocola aggregata]QDU29963.1 Unsaturated glucuronyl hydrolase [Anatilimnocola aggregata]
MTHSARSRKQLFQRPLRLESLELRAMMAALPLAETIYLSTDTPGTVTGSDGVSVKVDDSDVLRLDIERSAGGSVLSYRYRLLFDGSDVGLETDDEDIDALAILPDGSLVISTMGRATVPGVTAEDEDLLRFVPAIDGYGSKTMGTWSLYFDGSDVGLTYASSDIDALSIMPDGKLVISTEGLYSVGGVIGYGEDLLQFAPTALGNTTAGKWTQLFDGSKFGLTTTNEKLDAIDMLDATVVQMSTNGPFAVTGAAGDDEDVFNFNLTTKTYESGLRLDGSALGLTAFDIDAIEFRAVGEILPEPTVHVEVLPTLDVSGILAVARAKLASHDAKNTVKTRYAGSASVSATSWSAVGAGDWTAGFYPGLLWQMYEATGDVAWRTKAEAWTAGLESQKNRTSTHDLGFMIHNSFGQGERLTGSESYKAVVLQAAKSLSSRFNTKAGVMRSWDGGGFRVIIDNMMNLEMLFYAAKNGGTTSTGGSAQELYNMAVSHATKTLQNHVRADGSTFHVVNYNTTTGGVTSKSTAQGMNTNSTWSRGQSWAVYGFTMTYRETGDATFLEGARRTADYFIANLPEDYVPAADFQSPYTGLAHKDSSAAAISASALLELSTLETDPARSVKYFEAAVRMLDSLSSPSYFAPPQHPSMLLHGAQKYPGNNSSLIYGDYYYVEALLRYAKITNPSST